MNYLGTALPLSFQNPHTRKRDRSLCSPAWRSAHSRYSGSAGRTESVGVSSHNLMTNNLLIPLATHQRGTHRTIRALTRGVSQVGRHGSFWKRNTQDRVLFLLGTPFSGLLMSRGCHQGPVAASSSPRPTWEHLAMPETCLIVMTEEGWFAAGTSG